MPEEAKSAREDAKASESVGGLEALLEKVDVKVPKRPVDFESLVQEESADKADMLTVALRVFLGQISRSGKAEKVDKTLIDRQIAEIDGLLSGQPRRDPPP